LTIFFTHENSTDFALKERSKLLKSVEDKLVEINSLIDWKIFSIIFESIYFNKKNSGASAEADVIITLKMLVLQQWHGFPCFEIDKLYIDQISFRIFLIPLSTF
jgi:IS5 family transposase